MHRVFFQNKNALSDNFFMTFFFNFVYHLSFHYNMAIFSILIFYAGCILHIFVGVMNDHSLIFIFGGGWVGG